MTERIISPERLLNEFSSTFTKFVERFVREYGKHVSPNELTSATVIGLLGGFQCGKAGPNSHFRDPHFYVSPEAEIQRAVTKYVPSVQRQAAMRSVLHELPWANEPSIAVFFALMWPVLGLPQILQAMILDVRSSGFKCRNEQHQALSILPSETERMLQLAWEGKIAPRVAKIHSTQVMLFGVHSPTLLEPRDSGQLPEAPRLLPDKRNTIQPNQESRPRLTKSSVIEQPPQEIEAIQSSNGSALVHVTRIGTTVPIEVITDPKAVLAIVSDNLSSEDELAALLKYVTDVQVSLAGSIDRAFPRNIFVFGPGAVYSPSHPRRTRAAERLREELWKQGVILLELPKGVQTIEQTQKHLRKQLAAHDSKINVAALRVSPPPVQASPREADLYFLPPSVSLEYD